MTDDAPDSLIPYDEIVQEALRAIPGRVLRDIARTGALPGSHHFYITFKTQAPGVAIPQHLAQKFPDEMTIVLQHKFWDLKVTDNSFEVSLTFNQVPAHLVIPFAAIRFFVDPAVNFSLEFQVSGGDDPEPHDDAENDGPHSEGVGDEGSNVVTVDFGKKK
ncbi:MAG TPA: ClpXP protease specificity-enhancing factor SspB [Sphingobium sp.]|nr:ClpXP protease specificity-enhancing factor SspB [Sphingobium sp.]